MHFRDGPNDIEAQAKTSVLPRTGRIGLPESIEDEWQKFRTNSFAGIADAYLELIADPSKIDTDLTFFGELQGIRQQVINDLLQAVRIRENRARSNSLRPNIDSLRRCRRTD